MEYNTFLETRLKDYRDRLDQHDIIDPAELFVELDWSKDNRRYFRDLIGARIVTKRQVEEATKKARQCFEISKALGAAPETARDYARLYTSKIGARITYRGTITAPGCDSMTILDLARGARLTAGELYIPFGRDAINDAVEDHYQRERDAALSAIKTSISERQPFDWLALARECFLPDSGSAEFVAAVLRKFAWQVQRKLAGLPVTYHLMPVITGPQGSGKSWFVKALCQPLSDLFSESNFEALADDRNIDLFRSYIIFLDEMAKAGKADAETIKHVITADTLERRPMRTGSIITIRQNATCIATTNFSLAEIITDTTGIRRFGELHWKKPDFDFLNRLDFRAAWCSVQASDPDPMAIYTEELAAQQAGSRNRGPVEDWLLNIDDSDVRNLDEASANGFLTTRDLFGNFLAYRAMVNGGSESFQDKRSLNSFAQELGRLVRDHDYGLKQHRTKKANGYVLTRLPEPVRKPLSARPPEADEWFQLVQS